MVGEERLKKIIALYLGKSVEELTLAEITETLDKFAYTADEYDKATDEDSNLP